MIRKLVVAMLAFAGLMTGPGLASGQSILPPDTSDQVFVLGQLVLTLLETDKPQFRQIGPVPLKDGGVEFFQEGSNFTKLSDQIWVAAGFLYFSSDPDNGPLPVPNNANLEENGQIQFVGQYFEDLNGNRLHPQDIAVASDLNPTPDVPEPASLALLGLGAMGMAGYGWRKRKTAAASRI